MLLGINEYFHIYNRGVNKLPIFIETRNYEYFLERLRDKQKENMLEVVAYCLMPNHFHLLVFQKQQRAISKYIKAVCEGYTKAINASYHKSGHLFEGKYKIKYIDENSYLLHLSRYFHLNPARAGLVKKAEEWRFSSCREYYGMDKIDISSIQHVLNQFSGNDDYRDFIERYREEDWKEIRKYLFRKD